jgi:hypothetical protein
MLSPSDRQSGELFRRTTGFYQDLGKPIAAAKETERALTLASGSRVISLPGSADTVRGYSGVDLLILDEAAMVPDELLIATSPMRAVSRGRLVALSSPKGQRGWFYEAWNDPLVPWERIKATAHDCPRISKEFLDSERRVLGERWFKQEYLCSFESAEDQFFSTEDVMAAMDSSIKSVLGGRYDGVEPAFPG